MFLAQCSRAQVSVKSSRLNCKIRRLTSLVDESMGTNEPSDADDGDELTISNVVEKRWVRPGAAYFVATPLGNVHDMSPRARAILCQVDIIVAEDTRTTRALLRRLDQASPLPESVALRRVKQRFISHHKHNQRSSIDEILRHISDRQSPVSIAVVGDAGTPGISDPGAPLAQVLHHHGVPIYSIPGPCAMAAALSVSGFSATPSLFVGFAPVKGKDRDVWLERIDSVALRDATVVFYESPHRLLRTLRDITKLSCCSTPRRRGIVMCRELTKRYEEVVRFDDVQQLLDRLVARSGEEALDGDANDDGTAGSSIRGEFTLVLGPTERRPNDSDVETVGPRPLGDPDDASAGAAALDALSSRFEQDSPAAHMLLRLVKTTPSLKRSEAVRQVAATLGLRKKQVYEVALKLPWPTGP